MTAPGPVPVPAALREHVAAITAYDVVFPGGPGIHLGMPSATVTLVLPLEDPLEVSWADRPGTLTSGWSSLSGLHGGPALVHHPGSQRGLQLALTATGARALFGLPAAALAGQLTSLDEAAPEVAALPQRLAETPSWESRLRLLLAALQDLLVRHEDDAARATRSEVGRALHLLETGTPVGLAASDVGYSRRRLTDLVRAECGVTPKEFQRLARFDRAHRRVATAVRRGHLSLAEAAAESGYADQAHLTREWRRFSGATPTEWLTTEFPSVQDLGA